ncbi:UNVERIFIED_CONTAM: hypothetical protein Sradi_0871000 [Sesamum radiatum]|uniref:Reverse transcriptase zinc-binding domain-containing protein n=1 Tax=Sesamum radiatum TaxID=300843 RepID=A0AAW2V4N4_SESRA
MSVDGVSWDMELIRVLFPQTEADNILAVPIHGPDNEDQLVWHCDARGQFTVRSACRLAMEIDSESAEASGDPPNWAFIWKSRTPSKVQLFAWRLCHNALPTTRGLLRRAVHVIGGCPFCHEEMETIEHTFLRCSYSRQMWAIALLPWVVVSLSRREGGLVEVCM